MQLLDCKLKRDHNIVSYYSSYLGVNMFSATVKLSSKGQVVIPKDVRDSLHWGVGKELILLTTEHGVVLQAKQKENKQSVKFLRGFLQHSGEPASTKKLCMPVEYKNDSF